MSYSLGALPSTPDARDFTVQAPRAGLEVLPASYDLRKVYQPIRNQGAEGTCVPHAIDGLMGAAQIAKKFNRNLGVRTLYENARSESARNFRPILGEGCHVRDALKAAFKDGMDLEADRPYVPHKPGALGPKSAVHMRENKVGAYAQVVPSVPATKAAIKQYGGVLNVLEARDGFMSPSNGRASASGVNNGNHATVLVGWDDSEQAFILRNSWGPDWGRAGYCLLPYDYACSERWVITPSLTVWVPQPRPVWWPWFLPWEG